MTDTPFSSPGMWSYAFALAGFVALAIRFALGLRGSRRATLLFAAAALTAVWAGTGVAFSYRPGFDTWAAYLIADALRYVGWFLFVGSLLAGSGKGSPRSPVPSVAIAMVAILLVATLAFPTDNAPFAWADRAPGRTILYGLRLLLAVFGLVLAEQIYRSTDAASRWSMKPLIVALAAMFAFDLYFYADAMLFGRLDADIWIARGAVNAVLIPFYVVATARNPAWTIEMHVSRGAVFHSTAVVLSGVFLLVVAAAGYLVRLFGGDWGRALQVGFLFAALLAGAVVLTSGRFRSRLRVFVSKHFFSYRYDYRTEWLRFTGTLSGEASLRGVQEQVIRGLADLVESPGGVLCLREDEGPIRPVTRWNMPVGDDATPVDHPLSRFLARTGWVIDLAEYAADRSKYPELELPPWLAATPNAWIVVPLVAASDLIGFVVLHTPRARVELNWEVLDLLKVASRQAASYLGHTRAAEALLEARKFEAFNRMSAFVVHDLKNLVAQLNLMLKNAERHRDNPEFQRDMLQTVQHVVGRMNGLMQQLRMGVTPAEKKRAVDLCALVTRACRARTADPGRLALELEPQLTAVAHEDRLDHVIGHLVQNALDATSRGGTVTVRTRRDGRHAVIEVADTGTGMTPEFVRERLFRPFETSKKSGMGIGVYESSQYLAAIGGQLVVESTPNVGTTFRALLPAGDNVVQASIETVG